MPRRRVSLAERVARNNDAAPGAIEAEVAGIVDDLIRIGLLKTSGE